MSEVIKVNEDGGILKQVLKEGEGQSPQKGNEVSMLYIGKLEDGSVFDSNQDRDSPFNFILGEGQVIQGWDLGVATMKKGEEAILTIKPEYGYGSQSMGSSIPPNSTLIFQVELLDFKEREKMKHEYTSQQRIQFAKEWKQKGNDCFKAQQYDDALTNYKKVTDWLELDMAENQEAKTMRVLCLGNCSLVYFKMKNYKQAIEYSDMVLQNESQNIKAIFRKGQANTQIHNYDEAKQLFEECLQIDPANNDVKRELINLKKLIKQSEQKDKKAFANIFKNTFYNDQTDKKKDDFSDESNPKVFMDIEVEGEEELKRIEFELFNNVVPKTAENFRVLCTGEKGEVDGVKMSFQNNIFHRLIKGFMIQGGDITKQDGTGGQSIYGSKFQDENFTIKHTKPGLLSMANAGPGTNGSQFFITFKETPWLDGKHVVFGQVIKGLNHLSTLENIETSNDKPLKKISIKECGQL